MPDYQDNKRQFQVSIDPGLLGTGYAIWENGECIQTGTFEPPRKGDLMKRYVSLIRSLDALFVVLAKEGKITEIVVEEFAENMPLKKAGSLLKTSYAAGICACVGWYRCGNVRGIFAGSDSKEKAPLICKAMKIEVDSEHAADAVYIGVLAGFKGSC